MNWELYNKYGERNIDGYYINNHKKWHYYAQRPNIYKREKRKAFLFLLIPVAGIVGYSLVYERMGLSCF
jgi:hypothetical protein